MKLPPRQVYALCDTTAQCAAGLTCLDGQCSTRCDGRDFPCPPTRGVGTTSCRTFHFEGQGERRADCTTGCGDGYRCRGYDPNVPDVLGFCISASVPNAN